MMVLFGIILVAIGVGALLNVSVWPAVLVGVGAALVLSTVFGRGRKRPGWFLSGCWGSPHGRQGASDAVGPT